jgi:hypothetical protein
MTAGAALTESPGLPIDPSCAIVEAGLWVPASTDRRPVFVARPPRAVLAAAGAGWAGCHRVLAGLAPAGTGPGPAGSSAPLVIGPAAACGLRPSTIKAGVAKLSEQAMRDLTGPSW